MKMRIPHESYDFMSSCGGVWCKVLRNIHVDIDLGDWKKHSCMHVKPRKSA